MACCVLPGSGALSEPVDTRPQLEQRGAQDTLRQDSEQASLRRRNGDLTPAERQHLERGFWRQRLEQRRLHNDQIQRLQSLRSRLRSRPPAEAERHLDLQMQRFHIERQRQRLELKTRRAHPR